MISQNEFSHVALMDKNQLWLFCNKKNNDLGGISAYSWLMVFRRYMQEALSKYAKGKSELDAVQQGAIRNIELISKYCSHYYNGFEKQG